MPRRAGGTGLRWWTRSQPIRTLAEIPLHLPLVDAIPCFVYQQVSEKAAELARLGMSACAIARALKVSDKTVVKALKHRSLSRKKGG
jgi:hypothetical protein